MFVIFSMYLSNQDDAPIGLVVATIKAEKSEEPFSPKSLLVSRTGNLMVNGLSKGTYRIQVTSEQPVGDIIFICVWI